MVSSLWACGTAPTFSRRNSILAGLVDLIVLIGMIVGFLNRVHPFQCSTREAVCWLRASQWVIRVHSLRHPASWETCSTARPSTSNVEALKDANLVEKWMPKNSGMYPAEFRDPDGFWSATHLYYVTPGYNTSLVSKADAPKTFEDLLDPK